MSFVQVVFAWVDVEERFDPRLRRCEVVRTPKACMWLRRGKKSDVAKAQAHVDAEYPETGRVFVFPSSERDPLGRARREVDQ